MNFFKLQGTRNYNFLTLNWSKKKHKCFNDVDQKD